jgi:putative phage-type endonuclease
MNQNIEQRTPEWFSARKGRITASSVGAILGLSPFMKPKDVMRQMVREYHGEEREFQGNAATNYGTNHEPLALADYELQYNKVELCGFYTKGTALGASPDGLIGDDGLIEIKCPYSLKDKLEPQFKSIDEQPHYYAQIQFQLYCTDRTWCDFYQWSARVHKLERVEINEEWLDKNLPKLGDFYAEYLIEREQPNAQYYLDPKHISIGDDIAWQLAITYQEINGAIKDLEEKKKSILEELVQVCDGQDADIHGHKLTKVVREGSISYAKAIKDLVPDADLSAYKGNPTEYWKLS